MNEPDDVPDPGCPRVGAVEHIPHGPRRLGDAGDRVAVRVQREEDARVAVACDWLGPTLPPGFDLREVVS